MALNAKTMSLDLKVHLRSFARRIEMDRAVLFGVLSKIWGFGAGPVTAILIVAKFSPEVQGYYYTFGTILALQVFAELGLGTVIQQFASHEWSLLKLDGKGNIIGDHDALSRLTSIARIALKWYSVAGIVVAVGLIIGGSIFFSSSTTVNVSWILPWIVLCMLTGANILLVPVWSLLEGCNQVSSLYMYRFVQGALTSISIWIAILLGANLWTAAISNFTTLLCAFIFLKKKYWSFLKTLLLSIPQGPIISWRSHMLPMQWKIALSWISGYFVFSLFTPVLFRFHGPVIAGQFGMTWGVIGMLGAVSGSWVSPRLPQLAMLIAQKRYVELDLLFWKLIKIVVFLNVSFAALIWFSVYILNMASHPLALRLASRLLSPLPTGMLLAAQTLMISSFPFSAYLRAHKEEPIMHLSVLSAIMIGASTVLLGKYYSATGMAFGYLIVNIIIVPFVFLIWYRRRIEWHGSE